MTPKSDILFFPKRASRLSDSRPIPPWQRWGEGGGMSFTRECLKSRDHIVLADNLHLLSVLQDSSVDLVYIDPPFSTGRKRESPHGDSGPQGFEDSLSNPENFVDWLAPRLKELWRVLSDDGNLLIHLDA